MFGEVELLEVFERGFRGGRQCAHRDLVRGPVDLRENAHRQVDVVAGLKQKGLMGGRRTTMNLNVVAALQQ